MNEIICNISELKDRQDLFKYDHDKCNVEYYKPLKDIEIQSISTVTGDVSWNKITDYTVHKDLKMYSILDPLERFERFWASNDHSLIVWDEIEEEIKIMSPLEVLEDITKYSLIMYKDKENDYKVIPCSELIIDEDKDKTTGYDFTVENDYTFCTHDGVFVQDTAAIFMPMTLESQEDCRRMNVPNGMINSTQYALEVKHELVLSAYIITDNRKPQKDYGIVTYKQLREDPMIGLKENVHCHQTCTLKLPNGKSVKTILGRALFSSLFPDEFLKKHYDYFIDKQVNKKLINGEIMGRLFEDYTNETTGDIITGVVQFLRKYTSVYPASLLLSEFLENDMFKDLKEKYDKATTMDAKQAIIEEIEKRFKTGISDKMPMIDYIVASGSRGDPGQLRQMLVTKGLVQDAQGNILSVNECYCDGMKPEGAFMDGYGSRKGIMDRSRSTSVTGYLTRKLIYACASVILDPNLEDCGTKRTVPIKITKSNASLLYGRYMYDDKGNKILLTRFNEEKYYDKVMELRTPIYCKSPKLCKTCYGDLAKFYGTPFVGILAGEAMGERGSQNIMKTFHCLSGYTTIITKKNEVTECCSLKQMFDMFEEEKVFTLNNTQEEIDISGKDIYLDNNGEWTKAIKIIRHKRNPDSKIVYLRTKDGRSLMLQDNHPIAIQKENGYEFIEPKDIIKKKDKAVLSNRNVWCDKKEPCFIDAYLLGCFLGDGCVRHASSNSSKPWMIRPISLKLSIPENTKHELREKLRPIIESGNFRNYSYLERDIDIHDDKLAEKVDQETGRYSYGKHMPNNFLSYSDEDLSKILCGLIDTDGCIVKRKGNPEYIDAVRLELVGENIVTQIGMILRKFNIGYNVSVKILEPKDISGSKVYHTHTVFCLTCYPRHAHKDYFKESIKCSKFNFLDLKRLDFLKYCTYDTVTYYSDTNFDDKNEYVYDIETEAHQYSANGILVHNTAGATTVVIPDLIQSALDNNPNLKKDEMKKYFVQDNTKVKFNVDQAVEITLRHDEYLDLGMTEFTLDPEKSSLIVDSPTEGTEVQSALSLKPFAGHIKFADGNEFEIILDDKVTIPYEYFETSEGKNNEGVKCIVLKAETTKDIPFLFNVDVTTTDLNIVMKTVLGIIEKKNIMKYPEVAFNKLTKIYGDRFKVAYNHIEILISQIFRNKMKPEYPARLIEPYSANVHGIKEIAHLEGFLSGMLFENMGKSLQNGFINDSVTHNPMEQLLSDDFDFLRENRKD